MNALVLIGLVAVAGDAQQVMQDNFAIHILAMLLVGFGFLMVFVRRYGYVFVQPALQARFGVVDICGVHNLHGLPGLLGGLIVLLVVPGVAAAQLIGMAVTLALAVSSGFLAGFLIRATGTTTRAYEDAGDFGDVAPTYF